MMQEEVFNVNTLRVLDTNDAVSATTDEEVIFICEEEGSTKERLFSTFVLGFFKKKIKMIISDTDKLGIALIKMREKVQYCVDLFERNNR